jgi:hypothetical protein
VVDQDRPVFYSLFVKHDEGFEGDFTLEAAEAVLGFNFVAHE